MSVFAAVMTGQGTGAISTIQIFGGAAEKTIKKIFKPSGNKPAVFEPGKILLGTIAEDGETIDQVTVGCEGPNNFAINCHGNPLIVEMIMRLLGQHGAKLVTAEQLLAKIISAGKSHNTIALEAKLAQVKAQTVEGTKIIANQVDGGLNKKATEWFENVNAISLDEIKAEAEQILETSRIAKLIIAGCKAVIAGPPNSGKSTLLNCLAGRDKAIVTDIKGTTRDWVSARCQIGPLCVELFDTAGLDENLAARPENTVERQAQQRSIQILEYADLVLLVLDSCQTADQLDEKLLKKITDKKILTVLNKSDLPARFDAGKPRPLRQGRGKLPQILSKTVKISAKLSTGIENLKGRIQQICSVANFDLKAAVCITSRQESLLEQLKKANSEKQASQIITELLNGQLCV